MCCDQRQVKFIDGNFRVDAINLYLLVSHCMSSKIHQNFSTDYWRVHNSCKEQINKKLIRLATLRIIFRSSPAEDSPKNQHKTSMIGRTMNWRCENFATVLINWINLPRNSVGGENLSSSLLMRKLIAAWRSRHKKYENYAINSGLN